MLITKELAKQDMDILQKRALCLTLGKKLYFAVADGGTNLKIRNYSLFFYIFFFIFFSQYMCLLLEHILLWFFCSNMNRKIDL